MSKKTNVTQREIDFPETAVFVSKTDTQGVITYANDSFVEVSGYSRDELVGQNHNIVRHPDMPKWLFADMWKTINGGHPWRGYIKNQAKNGDHLWVRATVSPIFNSGKVVGFISLRKKPSKVEVAAASKLYAANHAPIIPFSIARWFGKLTLQKKLQVLLQPVLLLVVGVATLYVSDHVKTRLVDSTQVRANAVADSVIDGANMLMVTGQISQPETRQLLPQKISSSGNIVSLHLIRGKAVSDQFGPGLPEEQAHDGIHNQVMESKKPYYELTHRDGKSIYRVVTPYLFTRNFHGTDCLTCHVSTDGEVAGVSDIEIDMTSDFKDHQQFLMIINAGQIIFQVVLFFFIGWVVKKFVTRRVTEIQSHLADLVNGDMAGLVDISGRDEMGEILCAVQSSKILLGSVVDQITSVSREIEKRAEHMSDSMSRVEKGSQAQSDSAGNMAASIKELTVSIDRVATTAGEVRQISENSNTLASDGGKVVQHVVSDMEKINTAVMAAAKTIEELGLKSEQIQDIVKSIKEIADQTNLLALNAAIEAARAGEQGRGFAVVADEVRKLAEKTSRSTQEISTVTQMITGSTTEAVAEMVAAVEMVKNGSILAQQAGSAIIEINGGALRVLNGVEGISESIQAQSLVGRQIAQNVETVAQMSEENTSSVREAADSVRKLEKMSQSLEESVTHFKV